MARQAALARMAVTSSSKQMPNKAGLLLKAGKPCIMRSSLGAVLIQVFQWWS